MKPVRRIFVCVMNSGAYGREAAMGVWDYVREHGNWEIQFDGASNHPESRARIRRILREWKADGILGQILHRDLMRMIARLKIPAVSISNSITTALPSVRIDNDNVGRMAAQYFIGRGLRNFAFFGRKEFYHAGERSRGFVAELARAGFACQTLFVGKKETCKDRSITAWLKALPRPIGLLCHDVYDGRDLIDACRILRLRVPDDLAVLAGDNDEIECNMCTPPLSGVVVPFRQIGYRAALLMDGLLAGSPAPIVPEMIKPSLVATRQSTDTLGVADPDLAATIRYIHSKACDGITVHDVVAHACESRRSLERRFMRELGRTPRAEILRTRLEKAKALLCESTLKIADISRASGYGKYVRFARVFKHYTGQTPSEFREQASQK